MTLCADLQHHLPAARLCRSGGPAAIALGQQRAAGQLPRRCTATEVLVGGVISTSSATLKRPRRSLPHDLDLLKQLGLGLHRYGPRTNRPWRAGLLRPCRHDRRRQRALRQQPSAPARSIPQWRCSAACAGMSTHSCGRWPPPPSSATSSQQPHRRHTRPASPITGPAQRHQPPGAWRLRLSNLAAAQSLEHARQQPRTCSMASPRSKGQFGAGRIFSDTDLFDSVRYRGSSFASDDGMRRQRARLCTHVRGVAQTNATVEIRQNDILYTANVAPGPF